jgi:plastocyanin
MRALLAITATLALFAAGCGGDDSTDSSPSAESTSTPAATGGGAAATAVDIKDFAFNPAETTVKVGQKVTWTNDDSTEHNVVADDGTFKSEDLEQGDTYEYTADKAGTFSYVCTYHPQMKATLTVE